MLKNIEYKSIFMGNGARYVVKASLNGKSVGKVLSLRESKDIPLMSTKEKYEYATRLLDVITEEQSVLKIFDVIWSKDHIKHHQRIRAKNESVIFSKIHNSGGSVITVQELS